MTHRNDPVASTNTALTSADTHEPPSSRPCPSCGDRFTPHPRKPSQTYCSERCRGAAYRRRRARHPVTSSNLTRNADPHDPHDVHDVHDVHDTRNEVLSRHEVHHDVNEVNAVQHCPHCRQPVVLITLITTPAAAHVTVPPPPATTITSSGYHPAPPGGAATPIRRNR